MMRAAFPLKRKRFPSAAIGRIESGAFMLSLPLRNSSRFYVWRAETYLVASDEGPRRKASILASSA